MEEKCEWCIDNSYNPPRVSIYCGRCGSFVEEIGIGEEIPLKKDVLCADCQDELEKLEGGEN